MKTYSRKQLAEYTAATESNLTHWTKQGVLQASVEESAGTGHHRRFGFRDLVDAQIAACLNTFGVPVARIKSFIEMVRLVIDGKPELVTDRERRRGLRFSLVPWTGKGSPLQISDRLTFIGPDPSTGVWPAAIVVGVGVIIDELEKVTGDSLHVHKTMFQFVIRVGKQRQSLSAEGADARQAEQAARAYCVEHKCEYVGRDQATNPSEGSTNPKPRKGSRRATSKHGKH